VKNIHGLRRQAISSRTYDAIPNALASNRAPLICKSLRGIASQALSVPIDRMAKVTEPPLRDNNFPSQETTGEP
jgi:hypothetical protein